MPSVAGGETLEAEVGVKDSLPGSVKSATRVLDLFETLGTWDDGLTHAELADRLAVPKSSLSQLLKTLVPRGYVSLGAEDKRYRLGPRIQALASRKSDVVTLKEVAQPFLERITEITGESTFLNVLEGDSARLVARVIGPQPLVTALALGQIVPLYATAGGKAILAFLPEEMREDYLARIKLEPLTARTVASVDVLRKQLAKVQQDRLSVAVDELVLGITGIAAPVLSERGHAVGSVITSMPTMRFDEEVKANVGSVLREQAKLLMRKLGGKA
jgi:DNA-binding IclR family transcriptional regulator